MAKYLNLEGLTTYDQEIKSWVQALLTEGISDLASALRIRGLINTDTVMHTAYTQAKVGDVYFVSVAGKKLTYYDGAGTLVENEVAEIGDAIICLKAATGSTVATQSRWGALQVNWNVSNSSDAFGFGKTLTIGTVGGVALTVQIPSKETLGFGAAAGYDVVESGSAIGENEKTSAKLVKAVNLHYAITGLENQICNLSGSNSGISVQITRGSDQQPVMNVSVTPATLKNALGLNNVGNFKAVSTAANQGLTDTEKSNARANIGLGTASQKAAVTEISGNGSDSNVPTEKAVKDYVTGKVNSLGSASICNYTEDSADIDGADEDTNKVPTVYAVDQYVKDYAVAKEAGKGLSTNDYTTAEKTKLSGVAAGATADSAITTAEIQALFA